jgi:outer membrane receptor protein involved in Fe transport
MLDVGGVTGPESAGTGLNNDENQRSTCAHQYSVSMNWLNDAHLTFEESAYNPSPGNAGPGNPLHGHQRRTRPNRTAGTRWCCGPAAAPISRTRARRAGPPGRLTFFGWEGHTLKMGVKYKQVDLNAFQQFPPFPRIHLRRHRSTLDQPYRIEYTRYASGRTRSSPPSNKQFGIYIQDDWQVNDKLTLNLGVRWDYERIRATRTTC